MIPKEKQGQQLQDKDSVTLKTQLTEFDALTDRHMGGTGLPYFPIVPVLYKLSARKSCISRHDNCTTVLLLVSYSYSNLSILYGAKNNPMFPSTPLHQAPSEQMRTVLLLLLPPAPAEATPDPLGPVPPVDPSPWQHVADHEYADSHVASGSRAL